MFNSIARLGAFTEHDPSAKIKSLLVYDFHQQRPEEWPEYADCDVLDIADNGALLALARPCVERGASKKEVVVVGRPGRNVVFSTRKYYAYDAKFDATAQRLLVVAQGKKPFCFDLLSQQVVGEMPAAIRVFQGDAHRPTNTFYAPSEQKKNTLYAFHFDTGTTTANTLPVNAIITRLRFSRDQQFLYCTTQRNELYCFDAQLQLRWQTDFQHLGKKGGTIWPARLVLSEDSRWLCLPVSATERNNWGEDYVVDAASGELRRQWQAYQYRGRVASDYFGHEVLLHGGHTLNLETGDVSAQPVY